MARISGIDLPRNKRGVIGLTYIYGIGLTTSKKILNTLKIDHSTRTHTLSNEDLIRLTAEIKKYPHEGELKTQISMDIKSQIELQTYRGRRHFSKLPVRGQRTSTNARTRKGKSVPIAGKK